MAVISPPVAALCFVPTLSSSSFTSSQKQLPFSRVSLPNSFLGVASKPIGIRLTLADGCVCHGIGGAQMNLFRRFARIFKSYANAFMSIFEDPEKMLEQSVLDMNQDLAKMQQALAQVLASQKQIESRYKSAQQTSEDWYEKVKLALSKGDDQLAREALNSHKTYAENASTLKIQLDQQNMVVGNLVSSTRILQSKIEEAKSKKDTLKARAQSAKAVTKVAEILGDVNPNSSLAAFKKLEEKVWAMESQAEALNQLVTDDLGGKFAMLESLSVDDDLANMKDEICGSSTVHLSRKKREVNELVSEC